MDPRVAKTHATVMQAATDLLVEGGPQALTVDAVVARSGVAKTTVYRHWATRDALVLDVFNECAPLLIEPPIDAPFEEALRHLAGQMVDLLAEPRWRRLAPALMLLKSDQRDMAELDDAMKEHQSKIISDLLARGVDEGVLRSDVIDDLEMTVTLLIGPILMSSLVDSVPLDGRLADRAVDQFLAAHRPT